MNIFNHYREQARMSDLAPVLSKKHIPKSLNKAVRYLIDNSSAEYLKAVREASDPMDIMPHHGYGQYLRNNWGLWRQSPLAQWFIKRGVNHPDDMFAIINDFFYARVRGESEPNLENRVAAYVKYWDTLENAMNEKSGEVDLEVRGKKIKLSFGVLHFPQNS